MNVAITNFDCFYFVSSFVGFAGMFGYASIYGDLSNLNPKQDQVPEITFAPSERPWETIFNGSSHVLPPLTKLCSTFLASLIEKKPSMNE